MPKKELIPHSKLFTKNTIGEFWQAFCIICTGDVFSFKVDDVHCVFGDSKLIGRPVCKGCYNDLKDVIPNNIDLIKRHEKERAIIRKKYWDNIESIRKGSLNRWLK